MLLAGVVLCLSLRSAGVPLVVEIGSFLLGVDVREVFAERVDGLSSSIKCSCECCLILCPLFGAGGIVLCRLWKLCRDERRLRRSRRRRIHRITSETMQEYEGAGEVF